MSEEALAAWWTETKPRLWSLMSSTAIMLNLRQPSLTAALAANDQIKAASGGLDAWLFSHPCPDKVVGDRLGGVVRMWAVFGGRLKRQLAARDSDLTLPLAQLTTAVRDASELIADVAERLEAR